MATAATFVSPTTFAASSLETGRIGQITAAGGSEFGYAYTFALDGTQPAGVTIDPGTGWLSLGSMVAKGNHPFGVIVTNIRQPTVSATFTVTLSVALGVTSNQGDSRILHKTYDPHSGIYGHAIGDDWTVVFDAIGARILHDQTVVGDGHLRAFIPLRGNTSYDYLHNRWPCGVQYLSVYQDPAFPGARPKLRCIQSTYSFDTEVAIIQAGGGGFLDYVVSNPASKTWQSRIQPVGPYVTQVTLKNPADASNLRVGRWHLIMSYDQQGEGGPPNSRYYDYVIVNAANTTTGVVSLDRRTRHVHSDTYWERYPQDDLSFGEARIMPMDVGGSGGVEPGTDVRLTWRQTWKSIEFVVNPSSLPGDIGKFVYTQGLDTYFEDCVMPYGVPSVTQHINYIGCTFANRIEPDKLIETLVMDNCTVAGEGVGSSTGVELWYLRDSSVAGCTSSPRQMRCIGSTFDVNLRTTIDVNSYLIWTGIPGNLMRCDFDGVTFNAENTFTTGQIMPMRDTPSYGLTLGTDGNWGTSPTNQLQISLTSAKFIYYLGMTVPGTIVSLSSDPSSLGSSWGYVNKSTSPGDGTALWLNIIWVAGTKPTSGTLYFSREHETLILSNCTLGNAQTTWVMNGSYQQTVPAAFGTSYTFPAGYPATFQG